MKIFNKYQDHFTHIFILFFLDGNRYQGTWVQNKANGRGKLTHAEGDVYEGEWKDDKANGYGDYFHVSGALYFGYWKDDE